MQPNLKRFQLVGVWQPGSFEVKEAGAMASDAQQRSFKINVLSFSPKQVVSNNEFRDIMCFTMGYISVGQFWSILSTITWLWSKAREKKLQRIWETFHEVRQVKWEQGYRWKSFFFKAHIASHTFRKAPHFGAFFTFNEDPNAHQGLEEAGGKNSTTCLLITGSSSGVVAERSIAVFSINSEPPNCAVQQFLFFCLNEKQNCGSRRGALR